MRKFLTAMLVAMLAVACGGDGGGGDSARFCELMEEFVALADEAIAGAADGDADLEALTARVEEIITEAEEVAPEEISGIIDSTDSADQDEITNYVTEECGVELPQF